MTHTGRILTFLFLGITQIPVLAQKGEQDEGPVGIFQSRAEYNQFMGTAKRSAYGPNGNAELRAMIPLINDIALNQEIGTTAKQFNTEGSTVGLLSSEKVRSEIEMVDSQYEEFKELNSQIQQRMAEQIRKLDFSNPEDVAKQLRDMQRNAQDDLNGFLLPHQVERLKQLRMRSQLRRRSLVDILTSDPVKTELKITDKQSEELRDEEKKIEADLEKQIAKLRENARKRLLSKLNKKQENEVNEMLGDSFEFEKQERKNRGKAKGKGKGQGK